MHVLQRTPMDSWLWAPGNSKPGWNLVLWCLCRLYARKTTYQANPAINLHWDTWVRVKREVGCMRSAGTTPSKGRSVARCQYIPIYLSQSRTVVEKLVFSKSCTGSARHSWALSTKPQQVQITSLTDLTMHWLFTEAKDLPLRAAAWDLQLPRGKLQSKPCSQAPSCWL